MVDPAREQQILFSARVKMLDRSRVMALIALVSLALVSSGCAGVRNVDLEVLAKPPDLGGGFELQEWSPPESAEDQKVFTFTYASDVDFVLVKLQGAVKDAWMDWDIETAKAIVADVTEHSPKDAPLVRLVPEPDNVRAWSSTLDGAPVFIEAWERNNCIAFVLTTQTGAEAGKTLRRVDSRVRLACGE